MARVTLGVQCNGFRVLWRFRGTSYIYVWNLLFSFFPYNSYLISGNIYNER
jgi:hypothetical protein